MHWLIPFVSLKGLSWSIGCHYLMGGVFGGLESAQKSWAVCQRDDGHSMEVVL